MPPILKLLKEVHHARQNKYTACCPAHEDSTARLGIRIERDGRVTFHCWAGCENQRVLMALGVPAEELLGTVNMEGSSLKPIHLPFDHRDALAGLRQNIEEALIYLDQISKGIALSSTATQRLAVIVQRFYSAHSYVSSPEHCQSVNDLTELCPILAAVSNYAKRMSKAIEFSQVAKPCLSILSKHLDAIYTRVTAEQPPGHVERQAQPA